MVLLHNCLGTLYYQYFPTTAHIFLQYFKRGNGTPSCTHTHMHTCTHTLSTHSLSCCYIFSGSQFFNMYRRPSNDSVSSNHRRAGWCVFSSLPCSFLFLLRMKVCEQESAIQTMRPCRLTRWPKPQAGGHPWGSCCNILEISHTLHRCHLTWARERGQITNHLRFLISSTR